MDSRGSKRGKKASGRGHGRGKPRVGPSAQLSSSTITKINPATAEVSTTSDENLGASNPISSDESAKSSIESTSALEDVSSPCPTNPVESDHSDTTIESSHMSTTQNLIESTSPITSLSPVSEIPSESGDVAENTPALYDHPYSSSTSQSSAKTDDFTNDILQPQKMKPPESQKLYQVEEAVPPNPEILEPSNPPDNSQDSELGGLTFKIPSEEVQFLAPNDPELERANSFSYPKSASASVDVNGRNRKHSGLRMDDRPRKISIGIGGVPKKGYWGGMDDSSTDSDDSLLAQTSSRNRRRKSDVFVLGPKLMGYNRRQWLILIVIALVDFFSAVLISIQAPIYPPEAISKGVTATTYGILFGTFELTIFLMSPTFFNLLRKIDMQVMFNFGVFTTGISALLFGLLDHIESHSLFITSSFVLRIIEGIGDAAILTASYAIVTLEFPDSVANTFTSLEAFLGVGFILGPPIAGLLYESNGFMLPFLIFGICLIASGLLAIVILPKLKEDNPSAGELRKPAFLSLLRIPSVALAGFSILTATISLGFINSTLYAHLSQFSLGVGVIGTIFTLNQGMYCLSAPIWNLLVNRVSDPKYILVLGTIFIIIAFLFIGPVPFLPIPMTLEVTCAALALGGIALGGILVSGFIVIMKDTILYGFPDNEATFGMGSGLYASLFTFGSFIGLSSSGFLYDNVGFEWSCIFPLSLHIILVISTLVYILFIPVTRMGYPNRSGLSSSGFPEESDPLLGHSADLLMKSGQEVLGTSRKFRGSPGGTSTSYESIAP